MPTIDKNLPCYARCPESPPDSTKRVAPRFAHTFLCIDHERRRREQLAAARDERQHRYARTRERIEADIEETS